MIWTIIGIISIILLAFYFKSKNAVWGGFSIGIILGLIATLIMYISGYGFDLSILGKFIVVSVLIGFGAELFGKISNLLKHK